MFIAALFSIVGTWNQPILMIDKENVVYTHHEILHSHKRMKPVLCSNMMQLEAIILSELTQEQKTKYYIFSLISGS